MIFSGVRWHGLKLSFGNWLTLISLLSLLPMLAFSVFVVQRMLASNEAREIATLTRRTALAALTIGRELDHARITARVIALSHVAVRGDFQGLHALASRVAANDPTIQAIALIQRDGHTEPFSAVNKDGMRTLAALARIPDSDWWVAAGLPEADLEARAREPLVWMSGIGLLLVTLGVVSASLLGRELTRQVRRAAHGEALGDLAVHELRHFEARTRRSAAALHDARHDALTGLPSRTLFIEQADALNQNARMRPHWGLAALYIDLDGFKQANDRLGHDAGDRILVDVADALRQQTRAEDCAARLGGDEFVVALAAPSDHLRQISEGVAARIVRDVAALGDGLGCSIGVATAPAGVDLKSLLERADRTMLSAKRGGKNRVEIAPEVSD